MELANRFFKITTMYLTQIMRWQQSRRTDLLTGKLRNLVKRYCYNKWEAESCVVEDRDREYGLSDQ